MTNKKIAELMARKLYNPSENETEYAFQLFVERLLIPYNVSNYTEERMREWIVNCLNGKDHVIEWEKTVKL